MVSRVIPGHNFQQQSEQVEDKTSTQLPAVSKDYGSKTRYKSQKREDDPGNTYKSINSGGNDSRFVLSGDQLNSGSGDDLESTDICSNFNISNHQLAQSKYFNDVSTSTKKKVNLYHREPKKL